MNKKELKKALYQCGFEYRFLNKLSKDELQYLLENKHKSGSGLLSNIMDSTFQKLSNVVRKKLDPTKVRQLQKGEYHPTIPGPDGKIYAANFMGPGTKIDDPYVLNFPPFDVSDEIARQHDIDYNSASKVNDQNARRKLIRQADRDMINRLRQVPHPTILTKLGLAGIGTKNFVENHGGPIASTFISPTYFGRD